MSERFFIAPPVAAAQAELPPAEAQHVARVLRAKVGDAIVVFDGSGSEFDARIDVVERQRVAVTIIARREVDREARVAVTLGVALPKGDRQQWLVEKLTELGVARLVPIVCQRSVAQPVAGALARLERWVVEASKQCGRNRLLEIAAPQSWREFAAQRGDAPRFLAHPGGAAWSASLVAGALAPAGGVVAAVGPEGGWTEAEVALAVEHGWRTVALGPRILRVETAAIALATLLTLPHS